MHSYTSTSKEEVGRGEKKEEKEKEGGKKKKKKKEKWILIRISIVLNPTRYCFLVNALQCFDVTLNIH
jgi:hypothetical protein